MQGNVTLYTLSYRDALRVHILYYTYNVHAVHLSGSVEYMHIQ